MPVISVIVPYYNDDIDNTSNCIASIVNQTFEDIEVIIVDDGSSPLKLDALKAKCCKDSRIKLISQENKGVSSARNKGVAISQGKYIVFIDSDDLVERTYLEEIYTIALNTDADVVYSLVVHTANENDTAQLENKQSERPIDDEWLISHTVGNLYRNGNAIFGRGPWARIIKASIVKRVPFPEGVPIGEDVLWNLELINAATRKILVNYSWYKYMIRQTSVTNKYDIEIEGKLDPFYNRLKKYLFKGYISPKHYYDRLFRDCKIYLFGSYYGNKKNKNSLLIKWGGFNKACSQQPWCDLARSDNWEKEDIKGRIKIIAFRTRVLYLAWYIGNNW